MYGNSKVTTTIALKAFILKEYVFKRRLYIKCFYDVLDIKNYKVFIGITRR